MEATSSRDILVVVVVGRRTHIYPLLEICRSLSSLGHRVSIAGMEGQLDKLPDFISETHVVSQPMDPAQSEAIHQQVGTAVVSTRAGRKSMARILQYFDSFYPETHRNLKALLQNKKFDFILADFFDVAAVDLALEFHLPYATCAPQLSFPLGRAPFIPGLVGLQRNILTSEHASLEQRVYESWIAFVMLVDLLPWFRARMAMRREHNKTGVLDRTHVHFVNSFWGFDTPRLHSPLMCQVGPLLATDTWDPLTPQLETFLATRSSVAYVAFGTLAYMPPGTMSNIWLALRTLLEHGQLDGVVWSIRKPPEFLLNVKDGDSESVLTMSWVPQRAVLAHASTRIFVTHGGTSSVNEGLFHGVPMLCVPIHGDQNANALRCEATGVGLRMDKHHLTVEEAVLKAKALLEDPDATVRANCLRLRNIAMTRASVGPLEAAARIQEHLLDHGSNQQQETPSHLEMPSQRMGFFKRNNLDLYTLGPFVALFMGLARLVRVRKNV